MPSLDAVIIQNLAGCRPLPKHSTQSHERDLYPIPLYHSFLYWAVGRILHMPDR